MSLMIARIEVSIAGSDEWRPLAPKDGVFDEADETFDANIAALNAGADEAADLKGSRVISAPV